MSVLFGPVIQQGYVARAEDPIRKIDWSMGRPVVTALSQWFSLRRPTRVHGGSRLPTRVTRFPLRWRPADPLRPPVWHTGWLRSDLHAARPLSSPLIDCGPAKRRCLSAGRRLQLPGRHGYQLPGFRYTHWGLPPHRRYMSLNARITSIVDFSPIRSAVEEIIKSDDPSVPDR